MRCGPYFSNSPWVARNTPPRGPTSSPTRKTRSSRASSSSIACRRPSMSVISATADVLDEHGIRGFRHVGVRRRFSEGDGLLHLLARLRIEGGIGLLGQYLAREQPVAEGGQRVTGLHRLDLVPRAVGPVV